MPRTREIAIHEQTVAFDGGNVETPRSRHRKAMIARPRMSKAECPGRTATKTARPNATADMVRFDAPPPPPHWCAWTGNLPRATSDWPNDNQYVMMVHGGASQRSAKLLQTSVQSTPATWLLATMTPDAGKTSRIVLTQRWALRSLLPESQSSRATGKTWRPPQFPIIIAKLQISIIMIWFKPIRLATTT